jgi:phenylacetate-CoA ligase
MLKARTLDVVRSAYVGLPPSLRRSVGPILSLLPLRYRFGSRYLAWRQRIAEARRHPEIVQALQQEALQRVLRLAHEKSPFYRDMLSSLVPAGGDPGAIAGTDLWHRIPVINSTIVRREVERMCTRPRSEIDSGSTGGSSGRPLKFFLDKDRSPVEYAFVMDAWSSAGCTEGDWQAIFRGFHIPDPEETLCEVESGLRELRFSVFHMTDALMPRYLREIERRGVRFIRGYPSALATLAGFAVRAGLVAPNVRGIMLHSEYVHDRYRQLMQRAFPNARLIPFYGLSEKCAFAVEDAHEPGTYDFAPLYGFTELLDDDDRPVTTPGQRGRVVSTGLLYLSMPFIRYDTGDEAELVAPASAQNGWRLRLSGVTPRFSDEYVVTRSGNLFHASALFMIDDELSAITDLQFEQFEPGVLNMRCVLATGASLAVTDAFIAMVADRTDGELQLLVTVFDRIPLSPRGKRPIILQHLDTERFGGGVLEGWHEKPILA